MSDLAREELDRYLNNPNKITGHPEDQNNSDHESSTPSVDDNDHYQAHVNDDHHHSDSSDNDSSSPNMVSRTASYTVPSTVFEANTGPKGVISDAQSFEKARKRSFRRTLLSAAGFDPSRLNREHVSPNLSVSSASPPEDEEAFMRNWREARTQELMQRSRRKHSPSKRTYGTVEVVDANGYLDAIEKVPVDTVVVVCIYNPESAFSHIVEDCLITVARKYSTTRFIKLHHEIAEMEHVNAPALLAYKGGDVFASIIDIPNQLPHGRSCSSGSLEDLLKQTRIL